jgi:hypothetical protein
VVDDNRANRQPYSQINELALRKIWMTNQVFRKRGREATLFCSFAQLRVSPFVQEKTFGIKCDNSIYWLPPRIIEFDARAMLEKTAARA